MSKIMIICLRKQKMWFIILLSIILDIIEIIIAQISILKIIDSDNFQLGYFHSFEPFKPHYVKAKI